jgi:2,3-bisphosphoglycerate-dependent phosphoglycerate mutase
MRHLVLIRHSLPEIDPNVPARGWRLSEEGRKRCVPLAEEVSVYDPAVVVTSQEPKAVETGQILAGRLGLSWETAEGLHEHERPWAPWEGREAFEAQVARFFARPDSLVFGEETADQARRRFTAALEEVLRRQGRRTVAVVSHGTVMALLVAHNNEMDPVGFWKSLSLPAVVVLAVPGYRLLNVIRRVGV